MRALAARIDTGFALYSRMDAFVRLKYAYGLPAAGYSTSVLFFRAGGRASSFAVVYWNCRPAGRSLVGLCHAYESKTGEYRHNVIGLEDFDAAYVAAGSGVDGAERCLLRALAAGVIELEAVTAPPDPAVDARLTESRLPLRAAAAYLRLFGRKAAAHSFPGDAVPGHEAAVAAAMAADAGLAAVAAGPASAAEARLVGLTPFRLRGGTALGEVLLGVKRIPVSGYEAETVGDLLSPLWREVWAARRASDLVLNFVCPSFPLFGGWAPAGGGEDTFEAGGVRARYAAARAAAPALASLLEARRGARGAPGAMAARLCDALAFSFREVALSEATIVVFVEHVGSVLGDFPAFVRRVAATQPEENLFHDRASAGGVLLGWVYALRALHSEGLAHCDIHLSNLTLFPPLGFPLEEKSVIAYVADGEVYAAPYCGYIPCVIDFSQVHIGPAARAAVEAETGIGGAERFFREQRARAGARLRRAFPGLEGLAGLDEAQVFAALSAVDVMDLGACLNAAFAELGAAELAADPWAARIASGLEARGRRQLAACLAGKGDGAAFWREVFGAFAPLVMARGSREAVGGVYRLDAPRRWSGDSPELYPPWARLAEIGKHLGGLSLAEALGLRAAPAPERARPAIRAEVAGWDEYKKLCEPAGGGGGRFEALAE